MSDERERHGDSLVHSAEEGVSTHGRVKRGAGEPPSLYNYHIICVKTVTKTNRCVTGRRCPPGNVLHKVRSCHVLRNNMKNTIIPDTTKTTKSSWRHFTSCLNREKAEQTIWNRLQQLTAMKKRRLKTHAPMKIGILGESLCSCLVTCAHIRLVLRMVVFCPGCMAERLKTELLEREKLVDVLAGPDAYRDLPRLLTVADGGRQVSNVLLSLEETYADIMPVHHAPHGYSAFV